MTRPEKRPTDAPPHESPPHDSRTDDSRAARLVERLNRLPRLGIFLGALALSLAAFFVPGMLGAALVGLLALMVVGRLTLTWHVQPVSGRAAQLLILGVLIMIAASKVG